jgi:septum site-determining protein MinD
MKSTLPPASPHPQSNPPSPALKQNLNRIIGVVSGKGGVGKTVTAVNIGVLLANSGMTPVVVDADVENPSVGIHVGVATRRVGLQDVLEGKTRFGDAVIIHPQSGLKILPASLKLSHHVPIQNLKGILRDVRNSFDFVIVDSPPSILEFVQQVILSCDEILVVTTPDLPSVTSANKVIAFAEKNRVGIIGIVLNRVKNKAFELSSNEVELITSYRVLASIPENDVVPLSISLQKPLALSFPDSVVSRRLMELTEAVAGTPLKKPKPSGVLARLLDFLRALNPFARL